VPTNIYNNVHIKEKNHEAKKHFKQLLMLYPSVENMMYQAMRLTSEEYVYIFKRLKLSYFAHQK
jgi:hypothetical protein